MVFGNFFNFSQEEKKNPVYNSYELSQGKSYLDMQAKIEKDLKPGKLLEGFNSYELSQGKSYLDMQAKIEKDLKPGNLLEGFTSFEVTDADIKTDNEFKDLKQLNTTYNRELSQYATKHKTLMEDTQSYLKSSESNPFLNQNVKLASGQYGYVTDKGLFKPWENEATMKSNEGKNRCPSNHSDINNKYEGSLSFGQKLNGNYPLVGGTPMKSGQSCGAAGKNLYVNSPAPVGATTYLGCYNANNTMDKQPGYENSTFEQCAEVAADTGNGLFSLSSNDGMYGQCLVGDIKKYVNTPKAGGYAYSTKTLWCAANKPQQLTGVTGMTLGKDGSLYLTANDKPLDNGGAMNVSNSQVDGCSATYGGAINTSSIQATWGANCGSALGQAQGLVESEGNEPKVDIILWISRGPPAKNAGGYNIPKDQISNTLEIVKTLYKDATICDYNDILALVNKGVPKCSCGWMLKNGEYWSGYPSTESTISGCGGGSATVISCTGNWSGATNPGMYIKLKAPSATEAIANLNLTQKIHAFNVDPPSQRSCDGPSKCTMSSQCPHKPNCDKHNECVVINGEGRCLCVNKSLSDQKTSYPSILAGGGLSGSKTCVN